MFSRCSAHIVLVAALVVAQPLQSYKENTGTPYEKQGGCELIEPLKKEGATWAAVMIQKLKTKTVLHQNPAKIGPNNWKPWWHVHRGGYKGPKENMGVCGKRNKVTSSSRQGHLCPSSCPFFAEDLSFDFCTFACVEAETCMEIDPEKPVADKYDRVCRKPWIQGCEEYNMSDVHQERCSKCSSYYHLLENGNCVFGFTWIYYSLGGLLLFIVTVLAMWILNLFCRPTTNEPGLLQGLRFRSSVKLQKKNTFSSDESVNPFWPLMTNLRTTDVGGPGLCLHFNFQAALIVWAVLVAVGYVILSYVVDPDLLTLGTRKFGTPRDNCILVAWGWEKQHEMMGVKIVFLALVYVISFALCLLYSIYQKRVFEDMDSKRKTPKDFTLQLMGLPSLSGDEPEPVEEQLKIVLDGALNTKIVGVSVCWDYGDVEADINKAAIAALNVESTSDSKSDAGETAASTMDTGVVTSWLSSFEKKWLVGEVEEVEAMDEYGIIKMLKSLKTSDCAYVIFNTEAERDKAIELINSGSINEGPFAEIRCKAMKEEPFAVNWANFERKGLRAKACRLVQGFFEIVMALLLWATIFYGPFAWSVCSFNYANGREPSIIYGLSFSMIVLIGNLIMYAVAANISDEMKFRSKDKREACYMIIYLVACLSNVLFDFWTTYFAASSIVDGLDFRTYDGDRLTDLKSFTERFETYAMQRSLAENVYTYAFPSTYLYPFLLEPLVTVYVPLLLGKAIVRTHPELLGMSAAAWLVAPPMDMGRYADLLLNVVLAVLIFFFPGGYTPTLFGLMAACHIYIYAFDHYRVLRTIPHYELSSSYTDQCSQFCLVPCVGLILAALLFKIKAANCTGDSYCYLWLNHTGINVALVLLHCTVHAAFLLFAVPLLSKGHEDEFATKQYKDIAKLSGYSYFSLNPVHCLRSQYIHKHKKPCKYFVSGKDHLLEVNEDIGCFYTGQPDSKAWDKDAKMLLSCLPCTVWDDEWKDAATAPTS